MIKKTIPWICLLLLALLVIANPNLYAIPRFSAEANQACQLCHHNPGGAGIRNLYGAQFYSYSKLPMNKIEDFGKIGEINPQLNEFLQFGVDFRSMFHGSWMEEEFEDNSFLTMQGDFYLAITPSDRTLVFLEKGIGRAFETYVLFQGLPHSSTVRMGRFIPSFGWRFADHKAFVRDYLGFSQFPQKGPSLVEDSGIEMGTYRTGWEWSVAITNGGADIIDSNEGKAITSRAAVRTNFGSLNLTLGGSYRYADIGIPEPLQRYGGAFWGINLGKLTYLGEADVMVNGGTALVASHILGYEIRDGIRINGHYDFFDSDIEYTTGYAYRAKLSTEMFLTGYLEIVPAIEWNYEEISDVITEYGIGEIQLHVWF